MTALDRVKWLSIPWGDVRGWADKSAVAAINRALPFTRMNGDPSSSHILKLGHCCVL